MFEPSKALHWHSQTCIDVWKGYTGCQKTVYQKHTRQVESEFHVEIVSLIVQQLHAGYFGSCTHMVDFAKSGHI